VAANPGGDPNAHRERAAARGRNRNGRFTENPDVARRTAEMLDLRRDGWSYQRIADHYGLDKHTTYDAINNALREITREPAEELRTLMLERLDDERVRLGQLREIAHAVMERHHITVSNGQVVRLDGEPILDDAPVLAALDRLMKIDEQLRRNDERRSKILGLDEAVKIEHTGGVRYEVIGVTPDDLT
jgi:hypothetical protein